MADADAATATATTTKPPSKVKLTSLKRDSKKERDGEWIAVPDLPPVKFLVRSTNFTPYTVARAAESRKLARKYGTDPIPEEVNAEINGRLATEHLLLGWSGLDEEYTPERAEEILTDPEYREVRGHVYYCASQVGVGRVEYADDAAKNSKRRSAGT